MAADDSVQASKLVLMGTVAMLRTIRGLPTGSGMHRLRLAAQRGPPLRHIRAAALLVCGACAEPAHDSASSDAAGAIEEIHICAADSTPATAFSQVSDLIAPNDSMIIAAHGDEGLIRLFDSKGSLVRVLGRRGTGPGEFGASFHLVGVFGDSVIVADNSRDQLLMLPMDGTQARATPLPISMRLHAVVAYLSPSLLLYSANGAVACETASTQYSTCYVVADSTGARRNLVAGDVEKPGWLRITPPGTRLLLRAQQHFVAHQRQARNPSGGQAVVALPSATWDGLPGQLKLLVIRSSGETDERVLTVEPRKVAAQDVDEYIHKVAKSSPQMQEQARKQLFVPSHFPEVEDVLLGDDGSIWIRPPYSAQTWTIFSDGGLASLSIEVPPGLRVLQGSGTRFWAVSLDSVDRPVIHGFRIVRPGEPATGDQTKWRC